MAGAVVEMVWSEVKSGCRRMTSHTLLPSHSRLWGVGESLSWVSASQNSHTCDTNTRRHREYYHQRNTYAGNQNIIHNTILIKHYTAAMTEHVHSLPRRKLYVNIMYLIDTYVLL